MLRAGGVRRRSRAAPPGPGWRDPMSDHHHDGRPATLTDRAPRAPRDQSRRAVAARAPQAIWGQLRDPGWWILTGLTMVPVYAVRTIFFGCALRARGLPLGSVWRRRHRCTTCRLARHHMTAAARTVFFGGAPAHARPAAPRDVA